MGREKRTRCSQQGRRAVEAKVTCQSSRTPLRPHDQPPLSLKDSLGEASQTPAHGPDVSSEEQSLPHSK